MGSTPAVLSVCGGVDEAGAGVGGAGADGVGDGEAAAARRAAPRSSAVPPAPVTAVLVAPLRKPPSACGEPEGDADAFALCDALGDGVECGDEVPDGVGVGEADAAGVFDVSSSTWRNRN